MELSCLPVSLFPALFSGYMTVAQWAALGRDAGLNYIDINRRCLGSMTETEAGALHLPLPVMMVTTYSDFTAPDPEERRAAVENAAADVRLAAAIGARYIRLTAGQHYPDQPEAQALGYIRAGFEACIPAAQEAGINILLENHSRPGAWQYDDFDFHFERMLTLWAHLQDLPVGINYDTANAHALGDWRTLMDAFTGRIKTVHLNDLVSVSPLKFACVGEGTVELEAQLRALRAAGFTGPVCIEEASMQGEAGLRRAVKNAKALLKNAQCV